MTTIFRYLAMTMLVGAVADNGQPSTACRIDRSARFNGSGELVRLAGNTDQSAAVDIAIFRAPLAVNTDGAPTSYHPDDFLGVKLAVNRLDNGMHFYRMNGGQRIRLKLAEARQLFARWRAANWVVPVGYHISWTGPIAADGGKPCIFQLGRYAGYFGSMTALKNGLPIRRRGECDVDDQLDLRAIPAIALRGTSTNPLWQYGARKGDLVLAINPVTGTIVPAIIGDTGDANRIGEGSIALNMRLLGQTDQPKTYTGAERLDTGRKDMVVAVIPGSRNFALQRPYTAASLATRIEAWARRAGYDSSASLAARAVDCSTGQ